MATKRQILKYALLPGIIPRVFAFFRSGFSHIAYLMAVVYNSVRLLPPSHPYLDPGNIGRFGIRHVVAEASNNLVFKRKNIDQIIIYFTILVGLVLLVAQFALLILAISTEQSAMAGILTPLNMFGNPNGGNALGALGPEQDLAFMTLDRVFGVGGMFNSCISTGAECLDMDGVALPDSSASKAFPWPFHIALHSILRFYSMGIALVGALVIVYFIITVVAETATSGTPFGQRFNKTWVPVRLVFFFALIIPLNGGAVEGGGERLAGMNLGQIATLHVVRLGSNFATNGWAYFNGGAGGTGIAGALATDASVNRLSQQQDMIAKPKVQGSAVSDLVQTILLAKVCKQAYGSLPPEDEVKNVDAWLVRNEPLALFKDGNTENRMLLNGTGFDAARTFFNNGSFKIRFGYAGIAEGNKTDKVTDKEGIQEWPPEYKMALGKVLPLCGDITLPLNDIGEPGSKAIYEGYYDIIAAMWTDPDLLNTAACMVDVYGLGTKFLPTQNLPASGGTICDFDITSDFIREKTQSYGFNFKTAVDNGIEIQREKGQFGVDENMIRMGWVGASIYYQLIAEMNGAITAASMGIPHKTSLPALLNLALLKNKSENSGIPGSEQFNSALADLSGQNMSFNPNGTGDSKRLDVMRTSYQKLLTTGQNETSNLTRPSGNIVIDFINIVLGTSGLYDMRDNTNVHPLAQLSALGKGLMDAAIRNAAIAAAGSIGGNVLKLVDDFVGDSAKIASGFLFAMVMTTIGIATILYYILPLLPFIYFFFAFSGWIKSIFEAIVAIPLWALAHIRIDGEGLPGPGATNGYFLLLEIFLRPILIVVGFIASVSMFAALVNVLNLVFDIVVTNVGGFDNEGDTRIPILPIGGSPAALDLSRGAIDEFFFTVMYAIICYMMGMACFKLIDLIPNKILRWAGVSVSTFQENAGDPAGQLTNRIYKGSILMGNQLTKNAKTDLLALT